MNGEQVFDKGMVTDHRLQPPGTARLIQDFQITSISGNMYAIETPEGNRKSFSLTKDYQYNGSFKSDNKFIITSSYTGSLAMNNGEVGYVTVDEATGVATYQPVYNHQDMNLRIDHQIEGILVPENNRIERAYFSDFFNSPRAINIFSAMLTTLIPSGSIVAGKNYMVAQGLIIYNGVQYGPSVIAGTVFTGVIGITTYLVLSTARVVEYFPLELTEFSPTIQLGTIRFEKWITGRVKCGGWMYVFRLGTEDGYYGPWSYPTKPIHVASPELPQSTPIGYQKYQGHPSTTDSQEGVQIVIDGIDVLYTRIQVAAIHCTDLVVNEDPILIFDSTITGSTMSVQHTGSLSLGLLLIDDITKILTNIRRFRTISSLFNIAFIGDIEVQKDSGYKFPGATIDVIEQLMPTNIIGHLDANSPILNGHILSASSVVSGSIIAHQTYKVFGIGQIEYPVASANFYNPGDVFTGIWNSTTFTTVSGAPTVTAVIRLQKYTGVYVDFPIQDDWLDNKGQLRASIVRSLHRTEKYRTGILLRHNNGNVTYVHYLGDTTMPAQTDKSTDINPDTGLPWGLDGQLGRVDNTGFNYQYTLRNLGTKVGGINFQGLADSLGIPLADLPKVYSGFQIVRCPRDEQVVAQGLMFGCCNDGNAEVRAIGAVKQFYDEDTATYGRNPFYYVWYSPEYMFEFTGFPAFLPGDKIRVDDYYEDWRSIGGIGEGTLETTNYHYFNEFLRTGTGSGNTPAKSLAVLDTIRCMLMETGQIRPIANTAASFYNMSRTAGYAVDSGGTPIGEREAMGCKTAFLKLLDNPGTPLGFGSFAPLSYQKPLVSLVRTKTNLYGGSTDAAKAQNVYIDTGHFQAFDNAFMTYLSGNAGVANDIEVFGGDIFLNLFDVGRMIKDNGDPDIQLSFGMVYPIESKINIALREGRHISRDRSYESGTGNSNGLSYSSPQQLENFIYNEGYSNQGNVIQYPHMPENYAPQSLEPYHVRFTNPPKTPGERIDTFREFLPLNFRVVETRGGNIMNLRSKAMRLYYWQRTAIGSIPVNERIQTATDIGAALTLGQGKTAERFDERSRYYGNRHQFSLCETEDGFCWYNVDHDAIMLMNVNLAIDEASTIEGIMSYLVGNVTGAIKTSDTPAAGTGIFAEYESAYGRVRMSFKNGSSEFCVTVNTMQKCIGGVFSATPGIMIDFNGSLYSTRNKAYPVIQATTIYPIYSLVNQGNSTYICILGFTTPGIPTQPGSDPVHWAFLTQANDVFVNKDGDIGKFYELVYDSVLKFIVNHNQSLEKIFDIMRWNCSQNFFKTIAYRTTYQTATDNSVQQNREYTFRNRSWLNSVALDSNTGQMQDHEMEVEATQDNKEADDPRVSANKKLILVSVETDFKKAY